MPISTIVVGVDHSDRSDKAMRKANSEPALSLAFAVVASSTTPLLLLDGDLTVLAASASFCRVFHLEPASVQGRRLADLGKGEWDVAQLKSLLQRAIAGAPEIAAYEMDLKSEGVEPRRLVLNAHKVEYDDAGAAAPALDGIGCHRRPGCRKAKGRPFA